MTAPSERAGIKSVSEAGKYALKGFPRSKIREAFEAMSASKETGDGANTAKQSAAFNVCKLAHKFRATNSEVDKQTAVKGWREHLSGVIMELAAAGNKFAELTQEKDKPATAKLTGYGNNVASIAKGVIEFDLDPTTCVDDKGASSYREVRKAVEAARLAARDADAIALAEAKATCDETWKELRKLVFDFNDKQLVVDLTLLIAEQIESINAQKAAKPEDETPETAEPVEQAA